MLLFCFSCRMFSSLQRKLKPLKNKMGFFVQPAASFLCCLFFFLSFHLEKEEKRPKEKRKVYFNFLLLFCTFLLPPFSFLPIPSLAKVQKIPQFLWGVFHRVYTQKTGLLLSAGAWRRWGQGRQPGARCWSGTRVQCSQHRAAPPSSLGETEGTEEVVSDTFQVHPSCAYGWGRATSELENSALSWSMHFRVPFLIQLHL